MRIRRRRPSTPFRGQTLVETALVLPLFIMVITGIVILGMGVFYQQQLSNAAREAARYAAIHSATAQCPTVPRPPYDEPADRPLSYRKCDRPDAGWPFMTSHARDALSGLNAGAVVVAACWSGYRDTVTNMFDSPPPGSYTIPGLPPTIDSVFAQCSIDGHDPTTAADQIGCAAGMATTDQASAMSEAIGRPIANTVTTYACYVWNPPLAGFLLIPSEMTLRAVVTEAIQRQQ